MSSIVEEGDKETLKQFLEFTTSNELIKDLHRHDPFIFRLEYDVSNNGKTGMAFKNLKSDYRHENFITLDLDQDYYDFYLRHKYNPTYENLDLRLVYYLNRNYYNETSRELYRIKLIRDTLYHFSVSQICAFYEYPDREHLHYRIACTNDGILEMEKGKFYCPEHINV